MTWVKFHGELTEGAKRGIPRAVRFILMELAHKARPGRGVLDLPLGMGDVDALQDVLGGNPKEVRDAHRILTAGDEPILVFEGPEGARRLVIPSWQRWNAGAFEPAGASTQRSRRSRAATDERPGNGAATGMQRPLQRDATTVADHCNDRSSGDQRREEEKRGDPPVSPPLGDGSGEPTGFELTPVEPASEPDVERVWQAYLEGRSSRALRGSPPELSPTRRALIRRRVKVHGVDRIVAAARGIWLFDFNVEGGHTDIDLALRENKLDRFAGAATAGKRVASDGGSPGRPPSSVPRVQGGAAELAAYAQTKADRQAVTYDDPILAEDIPF
jgi:hypothetical protein